MTQSNITDTLEDYLEVIYEIQRTRKVARVRDIADAKHVRPASVTPAMKRLAGKGLVTYTKREYIELTEKGMKLARSTRARHSLLARFFEEVLNVESSTAQKDACSMEHYLSDECMDKLTSFLEFFTRYPDSYRNIMSKLLSCPAVNPDISGYCPYFDIVAQESLQKYKSIADMDTDETCTVVHVSPKVINRMDLLEKGFVPGADIRLVRNATVNTLCLVLLDGYKVEISLKESNNIMVAV